MVQGFRAGTPMGLPEKRELNCTHTPFESAHWPLCSASASVMRVYGVGGHINTSTHFSVRVYVSVSEPAVCPRPKVSRGCTAVECRVNSHLPQMLPLSRRQLHQHLRTTVEAGHNRSTLLEFAHSWQPWMRRACPSYRNDLEERHFAFSLRLKSPSWIRDCNPMPRIPSPGIHQIHVRLAKWA